MSRSVKPVYEIFILLADYCKKLQSPKLSRNVIFPSLLPLENSDHLIIY